MTWISPRVIRGNRGDIASRYSILSHATDHGHDVRTVFADHARHVPPALATGLVPYGALYNLWPGLSGLRALWRARTVIWTGGLDLQDDSSLIKLVHTWLVFLSYRLLGLRILLADQGAGPLTTGTGRWLARQVLRLVSVALVRDRGSHELLRPLMDERRLMLGADGIFLAQPWQSLSSDAADRRHDQRPVIGLNLRLWFHFSNSWIPYQFARNSYIERARGPMDQLLAAASSAIASLRKQHDARIVLFSMYEPGVETWEDDRWLLERLKQNFSDDADVTLLDGDPAITEFFQILSQFDLVIGMRLHSTLLALRAGVPAIHLAYTLKGHDIYRDMGLEDWVLPVERLLEGGEALAELVARVLADPERGRRVREPVARLVEANGTALSVALRRVEQG